MIREKSRPVNCKREILWQFDNLKIYKDLSRKALTCNRSFPCLGARTTFTFILRLAFFQMQIKLISFK